MIRKVRKPKVANSPTLPVGHPPRLVPIMFFKFAQLIWSINIKRTKSNVKKIFIFILGMQLNTLAQQKHSSFHVTVFLQSRVYHSASVTTVMFEPGIKENMFLVNE